jgi:hypothetical protein
MSILRLKRLLTCLSLTISSLGLIGAAPAATLTWQAGFAGNYTDPAHWIGGIAPGPGDTAVITGPQPYFTDLQMATQGDTISGQTIDFNAGPAYSQRNPLLGFLGQTTFAPDTTLNVTGPGQTEMVAYYNNALNGTINVGTPAAAGTLMINPMCYGYSSTYTPTTTNNGAITISDQSLFWIYPYASGLIAVVGPDGRVHLAEGTGYGGPANFANNGLIIVSPGGNLVDSGLPEDSGSYGSALVNNGTLRVQGANGKNTVATINANVTGQGTIVLDGGDANQTRSTRIIFTGNVSGQNIRVRKAGVLTKDAFGLDRVTGGKLTFEDENCFLWVSTQSAWLPAGTASAALPFGMPISGFRTGDMIAITRQMENETYTPVWDQANQQLTLLATNRSDPPVTAPIAMFTLEGTYGPNDFQVTVINQPGTYLVEIATTNNSPRDP